MKGRFDAIFMKSKMQDAIQDAIFMKSFFIILRPQERQEAPPQARP